jgi:hypothetical protein
MSKKYDIVTLIELVETGPCLWDKTSEEFKDRELKSKLWLEVYSFLELYFQQLDRNEQIKVGKYNKLIFIMYENVVFLNTPLHFRDDPTHCRTMRLDSLASPTTL